jgi:GPH family glycoside/pentoside/hexuronide:cation symporter
MENKTKNKLSLKEKIGYGFGDFGNGFMFDVGQSYLLKFYTDVLGISGAIGGSVFLISKIFDAFADTTVGTIVDRRMNVGKRGKFRPFILFATVPLAIATILSFLSPNMSMGSKIVYAYATYMIFGLAYSFVNIPYGSLASAMTQDSVERTQLASFRQAGSALSLLITGVVVIPMILKFPNPKIGYPVTMGIMAIIGVIFHILCYKNTKENIIVNNPDKKKEPLSKMFKVLLSNKPLMVLNLMSLLTISCYNLKIAIMVYYVQYNLGNPKLIATLNFVSIGCSLIGVAIMPFVVKRIGKKKTYLVGLFIWVAADLINYFIPGSTTTFMIFSAVAGFGTAFMNGLNWAFISDAIEYGEWKTGERTEGIVYSTYSFFRKLAQALAGFIPGVVLTVIGYVPNVKQTVKTLSGLKTLMLLVPAIGVGIAIVVFLFLYKLTDEKYKEIIVELDGRKNTRVIE